MKVKRILSLALALCLCLTLALAAGCKKGGSGDANSSGKTASAATVEEAYGQGLSTEEITALQNSGTIKRYTMYSNQVNSADWTDEFREEMEFYKTYYGLTIQWRYMAYGDTFHLIFKDYAANDTCDVLALSYRNWPKAGTRQIVYSVKELEDLGVVGLNHPEITRYQDIANRFRLGDTYYSPGIYYTSPCICAVNLDLFKKYNVKSPIEYYNEGNWNMETYQKCNKEITRTTSDGKIWGSSWRDHTYYLVANDARLVSWNDDCTRLVLTMKDTKAIRGLEVFYDSFHNHYSPSVEEGGGSTFFKRGQMGMFLHDANNFAQISKDYTFNWDIVPAPLGSDNTSGEVPGECSGNGIMNCTKNAQGALNYLIARSQWSTYHYKQPYGMFYVSTFDGLYNDDQIKMICELADHIGLDLYMSVGNMTNIQWNFWNNIKDDKQTIKEAFDTYEPLFQAEVDAENEYLAKIFK